MKTVAIAAFAALAVAATAAAAIEPQMSDQMVPDPPELTTIARDLDGNVYFVETRTMGRVGDTGYVWVMGVNQDPESSITFTRLVIDCPARRITEDWLTFFGADLELRGHEKPTMNIGTVKGAAEAEVVAATCNGPPLAARFHGLPEAMTFVRSLPTVVVEFTPGPVYYVTEIGKDGTYEAVWTQRGDSLIFDGHWFRETVPQTYSADESTIGNAMANFVCHGTPMDSLAIMDRIATMEGAIAEAKR